MACTTACTFPTPSQAHCPVCHHTFSGVSLFDLHRNGPVNERACYPPDAIPKTPTRMDARNVWRYAVPRTNGIVHSTQNVAAQTEELTTP